MSFMNGYTRTPQTTERLVQAVRAALYAHPTQRLGQVVLNAAPNPTRSWPRAMSDLFNLFDEDLAVALEQYAEARLEA